LFFGASAVPNGMRSIKRLAQGFSEDWFDVFRRLQYSIRMAMENLGIDALRGLVSLAMRQLSLALGLSALGIIGSVYFIVDMSLRGIEKSIEITNKRIDDLDRNLVNQFNVKVESLEKILRSEFGQTRELIRRGSLEQRNLNELTLYPSGRIKFRQLI
jgi:hypothetical protein